MSFHLALYSSSVASASANQQLTQVSDPVVAASNSGFLVPPVINKVIRVIGVGNLLNRAQLNSGSLRDFTPWDITPVNVGTAIESPVRELWLNDNPIPLVTNEELDAYATNSGSTATQTSLGVVFADQATTPYRGRMFSVHFSNTITLVAHAFTSFSPTLDNGLPSGTFAIVGARVNSASGLFFRFIPRGGPAYRPGSTMIQAYDQAPNMNDRYGKMGIWLSFTNTTLPQIECFALSADTAVDGFIDLVQTA